MNINDYERLEKDKVLADRVAAKTFYKIGRARNPHFRAEWATVPEEVKAENARLGFRIIYSLVDDYTTEGCTCNYCTWQPESKKPRRIMCHQRWDRLPGEMKVEIAESTDW